MKTLYVVYDLNDMPFAEAEDLKDAYSQARECASNHGYPVYIDKFEWKDNLNLKWYCQYNDLWFEDEKGEGYGMDCLDDFEIKRKTIIRAETEHELNLFDNICTRFKLDFNS